MIGEICVCGIVMYFLELYVIAEFVYFEV